jgi:hypothetical protein
MPVSSSALPAAAAAIIRIRSRMPRTSRLP